MLDSTTPSTLPRNPYVTRRVITNPEEFIGRQQELKNILDHIASHRSVSVVGPRRIGKTSLLKQIPHAAQSYPEDSFKKRLFVFLDAQSESSQASVDEIYRWIQREILYELKEKDKALSEKLTKIDSENNNNPKDLLEHCLRQLNENWDTTLLIDEFEHLTHSPHLDNDFYTHLRSLTTNYKISYVTSSAKHLESLTNSEGKLIHPRLSTIFEQQRLGFLRRDEAEELIKKPVKNDPVFDFMNSKMEFLFKLAYYHPTFLQIACYELFKGAKQQWDITIFKRHYADLVKGDFLSIWEQLDIEEQHAVQQLANQEDIKEELKTALKNECLINNEGELFSETFKKFASQTKVTKTSLTRTEWFAHRLDTLIMIFAITMIGTVVIAVLFTEPSFLSIAAISLFIAIILSICRKWVISNW